MNHPLVSKCQTDPTRDYSTLLAMSEEVDQSTNLPEVINLDLQHAPYMLKDADDFESWLSDVTKFLKSKSLDSLLDIRIPRPELTSPNARKWQALSIQVRDWLSLQMSLQLYLRVENRGYRIQLADEFIVNARIAFQDSVMESVTKQVNPLLLSRRSDFKTALEYVQAIWDHYVKYSMLQMHINPCVVLSRIFNELRPEIPDFIDYRTCLLDANGDVWNKLVIEDVEDACAGIILHLKERANPTAPSSHVCNREAVRNARRSAPKRRKRKYRGKLTPVESDVSGPTGKRQLEAPHVDWVAKIGALLEGHKPPTRPV